MASLFDAMNLNLDSSSLPKMIGTGGATGEIQQIQAAKSGKAVGAGDIPTAGLAERQAINSAASQIQTQVAPAAQVQAAQIQGAMQGTQEATASQLGMIDQASKLQTAEFNNKIESIISDLTRTKTDISDQDKRSKMDAAATLMALQDKNYVAELQDIGRRRNLTDKVSQENAIADIVFGNSVQVLNSKLQAGDVMSATNRDFNQALASISINDAIAVANAEMATQAELAQAARDQAVYEAQKKAYSTAIAGLYGGASQVVSTGLEGYGIAADRIDKQSANQSPQSQPGTAPSISGSLDSYRRNTSNAT